MGEHGGHDQRGSAVLLTLDEHLRATERAYWREVFAQTKGNVTKAARISGRNRTAIYKRLQAIEIEVPRPIDYRDRARVVPQGNAEWFALSEVPPPAGV